MNRGLTREQAEAGVQPEPLTKAEWQTMHETSLIAAGDAMERTWFARMKAEAKHFPERLA